MAEEIIETATRRSVKRAGCAVAILIILFLILFINLVISGPPHKIMIFGNHEEAIPYSEFVNHVETGQVTEVELRKEVIAYHVISDLYPFVSTAPPDIDVRSFLEDEGIEYSVYAPTLFSRFSSAIPLTAANLIMLVIWFPIFLCVFLLWEIIKFKILKKKIDETIRINIKISEKTRFITLGTLVVFTLLIICSGLLITYFNSSSVRDNMDQAEQSVLMDLANYNGIYSYSDLFERVHEMEDGHVTEFSVFKSRLKNIEPLSELTQLKSLQLGASEIQDVTPIFKLNNLKELRLSSPGIGDLTLIYKLIRLESLNLDGNRIEDIRPLAKLRNLRDLRLRHNQIKDIGVLAKLTNLQNLYLVGNKIADIGPLIDLKNLKVLDLRGNPLSEESKKLLKEHFADGVVRY